MTARLLGREVFGRLLHSCRSKFLRFAAVGVVVWPLTLAGAGGAVLERSQPALPLVQTVEAALWAPPGLVLWNKLGSAAEVRASSFGPNLGFYQPADCSYAGCIGIEYKANPAYVSGVFGNALTVGPGDYNGGGSRVYNVVLRQAASYLNAERGTIEVWYWQLASGVPYAYGAYRMFDGPFGLNSGINFGTLDLLETGRARLYFAPEFGGPAAETYSLVDGQRGFDLEPYNQTWIHLAGVWDRNGIAGSADTARVYLNGVVVAATQANNWGTTVGPVVDIGGGNDGELAGKFAVDNLKVWNYAKTDFSDRFTEGFSLDTTCNGLKPTIYVDGQNRVVGGPQAGQLYQGQLNGTSGHDVMIGTALGDLIRGGDGNDAICGWGGNDHLIGGGGADTLRGGTGNDVLDGSAGPDVLKGDLGADTYNGGLGSDRAVEFNAADGDTQTGIELFE